MLSTKVILLEYVCPALGTIIGNIMFFAPYRDMKQAVDRGQGLGDLNPTPWAFMLGNCFGWIVYGILLQNLWLFVANCPGFVLSVWLNLGATKLFYQGHHTNQMRKSFVSFLQEQDFESQRNIKAAPPATSCADVVILENSTSEPQPPTTTTTATTTVTDWAKVVWNVTSQSTPAPTPHEHLVMAMVLLWTAVMSLICYAQSFSSNTRELIVGVVVNLNLVFFYGAPLSSIYTVLSTKTSASIHVPTMSTNTLNGIFWTAYGLAILDPFIYVPNGLGAVLGAVQILLCVIFPRRKKPSSKEEQEEVDDVDELEEATAKVENSSTMDLLLLGGQKIPEPPPQLATSSDTDSA
jgi:solute carrier family 50 protein (sugar transporter)